MTEMTTIRYHDMQQRDRCKGEGKMNQRGDAVGFSVTHSHGVTEIHGTYDEACDAVRAVYGEDCEIGHDGDLTEHGDRTLCWRDEESSRNDDGLRSCAVIRARYASAE